MQFCSNTVRSEYLRTLSASAKPIAAAALVLALSGTASAQCDPDAVYSAPFTSTAGELPSGIGAGDLDNDGNADLVTANFFGGNITILRGNGDGSTQAGVDVSLLPPGATEGIGPLEIAIADFNGDGWNDIAIGLQSPDLGNPGIGIMLNDGTGNFPTPAEFYAFSNQFRGIAIADMNEDGELDIVYGNRDDNTINIVPGNGDGTFGTEFFETFSGGPSGIVVHDFNGDGHLDVAASLVFSGEIVITLGDGNGGLTEHARYAASGPEGIAAGDVNGDGIMDLATVFLNGDSTQIFLGTGGGNFQNAITVSNGAGSLPIAIALNDVNGDGFADIHSGLFLAAATQVHLSNGDGTFQPPETFPSGDRPRKFGLHDMNNDGSLDLLVANNVVAGTATVLVNQCAGSPPCVADTNGDGELTAADFSAWIAAFNSSAPECDQNDDGLCTAADFSAWIANFNAGC